jgi:hypothetical protein
VANERGRVFERMADYVRQSAPRTTVSCSADRRRCCRAGVRHQPPSDIAVGGGARDRADQPEGRGAGTVRPDSRADSQRGPQRAGDYVEVGGNLWGELGAVRLRLIRHTGLWGAA